MATEKTDEQLRKWLTKRVTHEVTYKSWQYRGTQFILERYYHFDELSICVTYVCDLKEIGAQLSRGSEYAGTYEIIADKKFTNTAECIAWTIDKLMEAHRVFKERTSRYIIGKDLYQQAISRPLNLQGD